MNAHTRLVLPPADDAFPGDAPLDLHGLIAALGRRLWLMVATAALVFAAVLVVTFQPTPRYTATADLLLDTRKKEVANIDAVMSGLPGDSSVVDTEVQILRSRALAERVVARLGLDKDPEFNPALRPPPWPFRAPTARGGAGREPVVDAVLAHLKVRRSGLTYVINVAFDSRSPAKAAAVANAFADLYLDGQKTAKFDATRQANAWLGERLDQLRAQVEGAEAQVADYKARSGLLGAVGSGLTEQEVSNLNQQLAQAQASQAEQEARLRTARQQLAGGSTGEDVGEALSSPVVANLRQQRAEVSRKAADLQTRYGPKHPEVQRVQRELADIDSQVQAEINRTLSNLDAQARVSQQRTASIQGSLGRARGTLAGANAAAVRLNELERNAAAVRALYESFLNRYKETSAQVGMEDSDARIVSRAQVPSAPSFPNPRLNLLVGLAVAMAAGLGAVALAESLDTGLATSDAVERALGLPHLAAVPAASTTFDRASRDLSPVDQVVKRPSSSFAEAFRDLRAGLVGWKSDGAARVVAVTSALPGEGKTTISLCLGQTLALSGSRAVVIDCDLRRRSLSARLGRTPTVGLMEVLSGDASLDQALVRDEGSGLAVLPLAAHAFSGRDVFGTAAFGRLLDDLRRRFDQVILDAAPVLPSADARVVAGRADAVLLVVQWRRTPGSAARHALRLLRLTGAEVAGVALSRVDMRRQAHHGHGDVAGHYRLYRDYFAP